MRRKDFLQNRPLPTRVDHAADNRLNPPEPVLNSLRIEEKCLMSQITRRGALTLGAGIVVTLIAAGESMATPAEADAEIAKFTGGRTAEAGKIAIDMPDIAENGT